ncbi:MAG: hypothetical protein IPM95_03560 [Sphingobacteriales bacterium]|nr:hypothetical protein [Sphingobacteriales bacterium]
MNIIKMIKKIGVGLFVLIVIVLISGFIFERVSRTEAEKISPYGDFVQLENHRLHYLQKEQVDKL